MVIQIKKVDCIPQTKIKNKTENKNKNKNKMETISSHNKIKVVNELNEFINRPHHQNKQNQHNNQNSNNELNDYETCNVVSESESDKTIKYMSNLSNQLFKSENYNDLSIRSDLSKEEIEAIALIKLVNNELNFQSLNDWVNNILRLRYSLKRKSRGEFINTVGNLMERVKSMMGTDDVKRQQQIINGGV